jgi:hypothetical protein
VGSDQIISVCLSQCMHAALVRAGADVIGCPDMPYAVPCPNTGCCRPTAARTAATRSQTVATWTRPTPDRDETWTKPSYVPTPGGSPVIQPYRTDDQPLYTPSAPEFKPAELPEQQKEMPKGPTMPGVCVLVVWSVAGS